MSYAEFQGRGATTSFKKKFRKGEFRHQPERICRNWNRDTASCQTNCGLMHICNNLECRKTSDRHAATHHQHRALCQRAKRPYWGLTRLKDYDMEFPVGSSPQKTKEACARWKVATCPLKAAYWISTLRQCGFQDKFQLWMRRTILEGVVLGYKGAPRNHLPPLRTRTVEEEALLSAQYASETAVGRVVEVGSQPPKDGLFPSFFVSPTYTIPKKKVIGQPQKWRLIHNLSSHKMGHDLSINAGIDKMEFPVTYPSIFTAAHEVFCEGSDGCVVWGRDLKAYYRHLMINPAYWWCTGTRLNNRFYFDAYCPFGARSMPAVFQRLSDAMRVIMLKRTSVDNILGMLDDFLGLTYRKAGESDESLLRRGKASSQAFDSELEKMGIVKQGKKDSPVGWSIVWLGFEINTKRMTLGIPNDKEVALVLRMHEEMFSEDGRLIEVIGTLLLEEMVGIWCHMSQAWALGKTLLWPLYMLLKDFREYTPEGKARIRKDKVKLGPDAAASIIEWYERINTCGIYKKFYTCNGTHWQTKISLYRSRRHIKVNKTGWYHKKGSKKELFLDTPWGHYKTSTEGLFKVNGWKRRLQGVKLGIRLLLRFLRDHAEECGDLIVINTNVASFVTYIQKDCYPAKLDREYYRRSVEIHRLLSKPDKGDTGENRMMHPRQLQAWLVY